MSHLPILPVLVPMFAGALLLVLGASMDTKRALSLLATFLQIPLAAMLVVEAGQGIGVYALGKAKPCQRSIAAPQS